MGVVSLTLDSKDHSSPSSASKEKNPQNGKPKPRPLTTKEKQDTMIMNTNNSCITSKRSVERTYPSILSSSSSSTSHADPGLLKPFVPKPQRRAPLINRGYWLRMRAIERGVRSFLEMETSRRKAVVNLGCGYDTLPFKFLSESRALIEEQSTLFIDVDYAQLVAKKASVICSTPTLSRHLSNPIYKSAAPSSLPECIHLSSPNYILASADLQHAPALSALEAATSLHDYSILFIGEVSTTYMRAARTSHLLRWCRTLSPETHFLLLEQFLPSGKDDAFARTMLAHFSKLNSPLGPALAFPSLAEQRKRFVSEGWRDVRAASLWGLWCQDAFLSAEERGALDHVEAFDEWEEFVLFAGSYFVVVASDCDDGGATEILPGLTTTNDRHAESSESEVVQRDRPAIRALYAPHQRNRGQRRYAASVRLDNSTVILQGGHGAKGRLGDADVYRAMPDSTAHSESTVTPEHPEQPPPSPDAQLMCHTLTPLSDGSVVLVGGRASPDRASRACWLLPSSRPFPTTASQTQVTKQPASWRRIADLPHGRFRHLAFPTRDGGLLVLGGKHDARNIASDALFWRDDERGWRTVRVETPSGQPEEAMRALARFGACGAAVEHLEWRLPSGSPVQGVFSGGIGAQGTVMCDVWGMAMRRNAGEDMNGQGSDKAELVVEMAPLHISLAGSISASLLGRVGAVMVESRGSRMPGLCIVGGCPAGGATVGAEVVHIGSDMHAQAVDIRVEESRNGAQGESAAGDPKPMLAGHAVEAVDDGTNLLVLGGGAVCFSFGTVWNEGSYLLVLDDDEEDKEKTKRNTWTEHDVKKPQTNGPSKTQNKSKSITASTTKSRPLSQRPKTVRKITRLDSAEHFAQLLAAREPVVLQNLDFGKCRQRWTIEYLTHKVGAEREVTVHESPTASMSFVDKNFNYAKRAFGKFADSVGRGEHVYLRGLSASAPASKPASLADDFPGLAEDFQVPAELKQTVEDRMHSSVLRVSGPVRMWLHYDVLANVLFQTRGDKTLMLYAPGDAASLGIPHGASSSPLDPFDERTRASSSLRGATPWLADLRAGEALMIPPLWAHAAAPAQGVSVAVNVFFRDLNEGYAVGRDVYGNRDYAAYERGRRDVGRVAEAFSGLPDQAAEFYLRRLALELADEAERRGRAAAGQ